MAISYKIRKQELKFAGNKKTIYYAQSINKGEASLEEIEGMISKISALSEGDVRSVLRTMSDLVIHNIKNGRVVDLGDLGRFRISLKGKASDKAEDFKATNIKRAKIIYTPAKAIRLALKSANILLDGAFASLSSDKNNDKDSLEEQPS